MKIAYLCLQVTREGQPSYAHVHEIIAGLERLGAQVRLFEPAYAPGPLPGAADRLAEFRRVQRRLRAAERPDVIYMRHHFGLWPAARWAHAHQIPVVHEINGPPEDFFIAWPRARFARPVVKQAIRQQLKWANGIAAVTPGLADWARGHTRRRVPVEVIPNGANDRLFSPAAADVPLSRLDLPDRFVVLVAALSAWQGADVAVRAAREPAWPPDVALVVVGRGALEHTVRAAADGDRIVHAGPLPYRQVPAVVARSLAALSPQVDVEGRALTGLMPLKVFETMACGRPIVVSDYPGMADLVRAEACGLVVPPGDPAALALAVRALADDPGAASDMGRRGREAIEQRHSWTRRAEATYRLLEAAARSRPPGDPSASSKSE